METTDKTGQPRTDNDINEAISALRRYMIVEELKPIAVFYPTIIESLNELLDLRKKHNSGNL